MELKTFIKNNVGSWLKIEHDGVVIVQNITSYKSTNNPNIFDCTGYSISKVDGEVRELNNFFMTKYDMEGKITKLSPIESKTEIANM